MYLDVYQRISSLILQIHITANAFYFLRARAEINNLFNQLPMADNFKAYVAPTLHKLNALRAECSNRPEPDTNTTVRKALWFSGVIGCFSVSTIGIFTLPFSLLIQSAAFSIGLSAGSTCIPAHYADTPFSTELCAIQTEFLEKLQYSGYEFTMFNTPSPVVMQSLHQAPDLINMNQNWNPPSSKEGPKQHLV